MSSTATMPAKPRDEAPARRDLTLRVARSVAEVEELREIWEPWQEHPNSVIENYLSWFTQDTTSRPHVMVVYRGGSPDCLLIGKRLRRAVISPVARLFRSDAFVLYFIQGGLLGNASMENCKFMVRAIINQLRRGEGQAAIFFGLPVTSPLYRAGLRVPNFFCRDHLPARTVHRYLAVPERFEDFLDGLPAKERQNISYRGRRLLKKFPGKVRLQRFRREDDVQRLIHDAEKIAEKTYQRALGRGFHLADGAGLCAEARNGSLRGYVLYVDEKPCAFLIGSWRKGALYGTFAGHDPEYREFSLGRYLLLQCVRDCFLEKTFMIDPGLGDQDYKRVFTNGEWEDAELAIHPPTFRGFLRNLARTTLSFAAHSAKALFSRTHLLPFVRKNRRFQVLRQVSQSED
jgi:Acetyltransferase (GNAT) domain